VTKTTRQRQAGKPVLDLIEEAVGLLRTAPKSTIACYYIGALPFMLGLLYFWTDMSRGAFAYEHLARGSLGMAALFLWMKCWQAAFAAGIRAHVAAEPPPRWTFTRIRRLAIVQAAVQPLGLFVRLAALLITVPYAWVRAFYHNVTALGDGESGDVKAIVAAAWSQARLWPKQNHLALAVLTLFGFFVWLNVTIVICTLPALLKMFLGIETMFTKSGWGAVNSTLFAATCAGTYLCLNPLTTTIYTLRCFYGKSVRSGDDLKTSLKLLGDTAMRAAAMIAVGLFALAGGLRAADTTSTAPPQPAQTAPVAPATPVDPGALDQSLDKVLKRSEFSWRMPREKDPHAEKGLIEGFIDDVLNTIGDWFRSVGRWIRKIFDKLDEWLRPKEPKTPKGYGLSGFDLGKVALAALYVVIGAVVLVLIWLSWKAWRDRRRQPELMSEAIAVMPDLASEDVTASQLPEDGWLRLAREMTEKGDLRLALRALYLAGLAHLGSRELISIAKHKSNLDYERELRRRARARHDLLTAFDENRSVFEWAWYGMHDVTHDLVNGFAANLERIRTC
jgi:hypothetical protein